MQAMVSDCSESSQKSRKSSKDLTLRVPKDSQVHKKRTDAEQLCEFSEHSQDSRQPMTISRNHIPQNSNVCATMKSESLEHS